MFSRCMCGWEKEYRNPVAARFGWEKHIEVGACQAYNDALLILTGRKEQPKMPDRGKYFQGGNFLKATDVKDGQTVTVEKFEEAKTRLGTRPILRLKGMEQPFGLNATNFDKMIEKFGENEKDWAGKKIRLMYAMAPNPSQGGKETRTLRIA